MLLIIFFKKNICLLGTNLEKKRKAVFVVEMYSLRSLLDDISDI